MKRAIFYSVLFGLSLALMVGCAQALTTPTQAPPDVEKPTEAPPTEALVPTPTDAATEVEETEPPATETPTDEAVVEETEATEDMVDEIEALIVDRCSGCHSVDRVFNADKTQAEWEANINRMIDYGANVSEDEKQLMIDWLVSRED
mgnify:CR=1 FL=1